MSTPFSLYTVSALSALLPAILGLWTWKRLSTALRVLTVLASVGLLCDLIGNIFLHVTGSNILIANIYIILQSVLVGSYFIQLEELSASKRYIVMCLFIIFMCSTLLLVIFGPPFSVLNKWQLTLSSTGVILYSFLYFTNMVKHGLVTPIWLKPSFYIVSGLMLYHTSNTGLFLTIDYFHPDTMKELWQFKLVGYVILNLSLFIAIIIASRPLKYE